MSVLYPVSGIARLAGCTDSYVRYLDKKGILCPRRDATGRRLYEAIDAEVIRKHRAATMKQVAAQVQP